MPDSFIYFSHNESSGIGSIARMKSDGTAQEIIFRPPAVSTPAGDLIPYAVPIQASPDATRLLIGVAFPDQITGGGNWYWSPSYFYVINADGSSPIRVGQGSTVGAVFTSSMFVPKSAFTGTDFGVPGGTWLDDSTVVLLSQKPTDGARKGWQICPSTGGPGTFVDVGPVADGGTSLDYGDYTQSGVIIAHPDTAHFIYGAVNVANVAQVLMAKHDGTSSTVVFSDLAGGKSWQLLGIFVDGYEYGYRYYLYDANASDWWVKSPDGALNQHVRDSGATPPAAAPGALSTDDMFMAAGNTASNAIFTCPYDSTLDTPAAVHVDTLSTPAYPGFFGICWLTPSGGGVTPPTPPPPSTVQTGPVNTGLIPYRRVVGSGP